MLDTSSCTCLMKRQSPEIRERFVDCFVGNAVISATTLAEMEFGVAYSREIRARNQAALESLLKEI